MYTRRWIFGSVLSWVLAGLCVSQHTTTTCEEFEKGASFDPFKIMDAKWRIIYFYSDTIEIRPIVFSIIAKKRLDHFKAVVDALDPHMGAEWEKATFMMEPKPGVQVVMIYMGTPGAFRGIVKVEQREKGILIDEATSCHVDASRITLLEPVSHRNSRMLLTYNPSIRPYPEPLIKLADLRFKLEDRYLAMMCCEDMTAFVLARNDEVPSTEEECEKAALKFGLQGSGGKSHLFIKNLTRTEL